MTLPKNLHSYFDEDRILRLAIQHGGVRVPMTALPGAQGRSVKSRAERFRFRFYYYRRLLAKDNPSRAAEAFRFDVKIDEFGDLSLVPKPTVETITTLDGRAIEEVPEEIAAEAAALAAFLREEDL